MPDLTPRIEFAAFLNVAARTLDRWATRGIYGVVLRKHLVGDRAYYLLSDYEAWQKQVAVSRRECRARTFAKPTRQSRRERQAIDDRLRRRGMRVPEGVG